MNPTVKGGEQVCGKLILAVIGVQMLIQGVGGAVTEFQKMGVG